MKRNIKWASAHAAPKAVLLHTLALLLLALLPGAASAQWTQPDANGNTNYPNGNVGIGTANPDKKLTVVDGTDLYLKFLRSNNSGIYIYSNGDYNGINAYDFANALYKPLTLGWGGTDVYLARTGGNVGVGTTAPGKRLEVLAPDGEAARLYRNAAHAGWGVNMTFALNNSSGVRTDYAGLHGVLGSPAAGAEAGNLIFTTATGGALTEKMRITSEGKVGIGTGSPDKLFTVQGQIASPLDTMSVIRTTGSNNGFGLALDSTGAGNNNLGFLRNGAAKAGMAWDNPRSFLGMVNWAYANSDFALRLNSDGSLSYHDSLTYPAPERFRVTAAGDMNVSGAITGGSIQAKYQDVAEWVPSVQKLSAGTVVVLDAARANHVVASGKPYDTAVAGVVSEQPGVILGVAGEGKLKVATTGRVKVKVDATRGAIHIGDLIVTSGVEGVAMKSEPVAIGGRQFHAPGTIIGKALEPLEKGAGEILVLLSLQ